MNENVEHVEAKLTTRVPSNPAVQRLLELHGELKEGDEITYATIEEAVMEPRRSNRARSVISAWRKYLLSENIVLRNVPNKGYEVCDTTGRILTCVAKEQQARRRIKDVLYIANNSDRDSMSCNQIGYVQAVNRNYASIMLFEGVKPKHLEAPAEPGKP